MFGLPPARHAQAVTRSHMISSRVSFQSQPAYTTWSCTAQVTCIQVTESHTCVGVLSHQLETRQRDDDQTLEQPGQ